MRRRWLRVRPGREENSRAAALALGAAAGVGAVIFYFARLFLSREEMLPPRDIPGGSGTGHHRDAPGSSGRR